MSLFRKLKREGDFTYLTSDVEGYPAGTVFYGSRVIYGYPHIPRIYVLKEGITKNISEERFFVEEKIDGYNVRLVFIEGRIVAFTRQGRYDPFATHKLSTPQVRKFFEKHPNLVLCGELLGNTPFTKPTEKFDVKFYVFDIMDGQSFLPLDEKRKLIREFNLPPVPFLGEFNKEKIKWERLRALALGLHKEGKEGMVIKSYSRREAVKYVTPSSDISAVREGAKALFDFPSGFFNQRITRAYLFADELGLEKEKLEEALGKAFFEGLKDALASIKEFGDVREEFRVFVESEDVWKEIEGMLKKSREIRIADVYVWKTKKGVGVRFYKVYRKTTSLLKRALEGVGFID